MTEPDGKTDKPRAHATRSQAKAADFAWLHETRAAQAQGDDPGKPMVIGPEVVLCDSGELDDLAHLLIQLGEPPLRVRPRDLRTLQPWEQPGRLFVASARVAFKPLPRGLERPGVVLMAVAEANAATVTTAMQRRGFRYVVRRPVHPEALRLLLAQILFRGREQRRAARFPYGAEIRWRMGFRRGSCMMADISSVACRLLLGEPLPVGSRITLKVPLERTGKRCVKLKGRLLRRDYGRRDSITTPPSTLIGFEQMSARTRGELDLVLAACAAGPASTRDGQPGLVHEAPLSDEGLEPRFGVSAWERAHDSLRDDEPEAAPPDYDRRLSPRAQLDRQVVALDRERDRVLHSLFGRDLSVGGMSVDPHPLLMPGELMRIALYGPDREPIVVEARVVRADGARGLGLRFERVSPELHARLEALVGTLPSVESLAEDAKRAEGIVLGEIVLMKARPADLARRGVARPGGTP
jgi:hypothetical protein